MNVHVAARALCEFTDKAGDLDLRFTPAATALEGIAGHAIVSSRRTQQGDGYEAEVSVCGEFDRVCIDADAGQGRTACRQRGA